MNFLPIVSRLFRVRFMDSMKLRGRDFSFFIQDKKIVNLRLFKTNLPAQDSILCVFIWVRNSLNFGPLHETNWKRTSQEDSYATPAYRHWDTIGLHSTVLIYPPFGKPTPKDKAPVREILMHNSFVEGTRQSVHSHLVTPVERPGIGHKLVNDKI